MIYTIYKVTNLINGKCYIGFDSKWPRRKSYHLASARKGQGYALHAAIRKYGEENFSWEPIYQSKDKDHTLLEMEEFFIREYNSFASGPNPRGYNMTMGGEGQKLRAMSKETRAKKSRALKNKPSPLSRWIITPYGRFHGITQASLHTGIHLSSIGRFLRSSKHPEWYYEDDPKTIIKPVEETKGSSQEVSTPYGTFSSIAEASRNLNIPASTISDRLISDHFPDWFYTGRSSKPGTRPIVTPHGEFPSAAEASRQLNLPRSSIAAKIRSKKNSEWYYKDSPKDCSSYCAPAL